MVILAEFNTYSKPPTFIMAKFQLQTKNISPFFSPNVSSPPHDEPGNAVGGLMVLHPAAVPLNPLLFVHCV